MVNIAFAGGGTGGHVFPIKSLIEYIKKDNNLNNIFNKIYWFGEKDSLEQRVANNINIENLEFIEIVSGKIRREKSLKGLFKNFIDIFKFCLGIIYSIYLIWTKKIDVIFCKGGYVAGPIVFAGWILRKKIFVHESDTVPGIANVFASKFADVVFTGFPNVLKKPVVVGQILSDNIINYEPIETTLSISKTNVLVMGGSQGSKTIYESLLSILDKDNLDNYNFFIVLGTQNIGFKESFSRFSNVQCFDFVSQFQMGYLCNISDIGITRGGATSLAEQKLYGMKLIIIPLPYTGGNHQYYNGLYYQNHFDDILINQDTNLLNSLSITLNKLSGYKKSFSGIPEVDNTKKIIFENILSHI